MRGGKRPTCEECGKVDLSQENNFVIRIINEWFHSIVSISGMGGWSINVQGVKEVIKEEGNEVDSLPLFLRRLDVGLSQMFEIDKKEEDENAN